MSIASYSEFEHGCDDSGRSAQCDFFIKLIKSLKNGVSLNPGLLTV